MIFFFLFLSPSPRERVRRPRTVGRPAAGAAAAGAGRLLVQGRPRRGGPGATVTLRESSPTGQRLAERIVGNET